MRVPLKEDAWLSAHWIIINWYLNSRRPASRWGTRKTTAWGAKGWQDGLPGPVKIHDTMGGSARYYYWAYLPRI